MKTFVFWVNFAILRKRCLIFSNRLKISHIKNSFFWSYLTIYYMRSTLQLKGTGTIKPCPLPIHNPKLSCSKRTISVIRSDTLLWLFKIWNFRYQSRNTFFTIKLHYSYSFMVIWSFKDSYRCPRRWILLHNPDCSKVWLFHNSQRYDVTFYKPNDTDWLISLL